MKEWSLELLLKAQIRGKKYPIGQDGGAIEDNTGGGLCGFFGFADFRSVMRREVCLVSVGFEEVTFVGGLLELDHY